MADVHTTQEFEDTHVTLTPVNPDGQQQGSYVSSQFVTSMLNLTPDAGIDSLFETTSQMDVQIIGTSSGLKTWCLAQCGVKNWESAQDVYSKRRIIAVTELQIVEWHNYKHLDWIMMRRDDDKKANKSDGQRTLCFQRLFKNVHKKHHNPKACRRPSTRCRKLPKEAQLTKPDTYRFDLKRKEAYTTYFNPRGFIYQNKDKQNRLMRINELHKFSDGTLNDVRTALDDRIKGIRMKYLPQTIWRKSDKERATSMIQAIDKQLKTRRIMRSLERFVGERLYEGDLRMLQRTI
nr:hypothetical protein [Tanacetum cinerariifolium]